jgi:(p)ppGpp synthase/HD superfamily hydrolase
MASAPTPLNDVLGLPERSCTREALAFADARHAGQRRKGDGAPFMLHPLEVGWLLHEHGYSDEVIAAGVLHDVLENTDTPYDELEQRFGPLVAELVADVSHDPSIEDDAQRKAALRAQVAGAGLEAAAIFAADKISKTRELRARAARAPCDAADRIKLDHYERSLTLLSGLLPRHALVKRFRQELDQLRATL